MIVSTLADVAARAELARADAVLTPVIYKLGRGGYDPNAAHPWNLAMGLDCSGFAAWCLGLPRRYPPMPGDGEWIETSAIYADAHHGQVVFELRAAAEPGCLVVWPDRHANGKTRQGHVGVVVAVSPDLLGVARPTAVIHCSVGNVRVHGNAVWRTGPSIFEKNAAIVCALRFPLIP